MKIVEGRGGGRKEGRKVYERKQKGKKVEVRKEGCSRKEERK
jgi:hypothetical protein